MLIGKFIYSYKGAFLTLTLCLIMLVESVLAEKVSNKSSKSSSSNSQSRQVVRSSSPPKVQRSLNVGTTPTMTITRTHTSKPRIGLNVSRLPSASNIRKISKTSIDRSNRVISSRKSSNPTISSMPTFRIQSSFSNNKPPVSRKPAGVGSSIVKGSTINSGSRISSTRTSLIGGSHSLSINKQGSNSNKRSLVTISRKPLVSNNHLNQGKSLRTNSSTITIRPSIPSKSSGSTTSISGKISSSRTFRIGSQINRQKSLTQPSTKSTTTHQSKGISSLNSSRINNLKSKSRVSVSTVRNKLSINPSKHISSDKIQHLGDIIGKKRTSSPIIRKVNRDSGQKHDVAVRVGSSNIKILGKSKARDAKDLKGPSESDRRHKDVNLRVVDKLRSGKKVDNRKHGVGTVSLHHAEHPNNHLAVRDTHRHEHIYWDSHKRLCHRIIWPRYRYVLYYSYGPYSTLRYVYPYYLRRYVFVNLGGYWPIRYRYTRYYWYGCHPYRWYGYYPIASEVEGDTYNYYTYNYYYDDGGTVASVPSQVVDGIQSVDHNTFADIREKIAQQEAEKPGLETLADTYFDEGVKAFEAGNFEISIEKFNVAMELAPDDMVLPFAYSQALFANGCYSETAEVLRAALVKVTPEKEGVFYPRGLYLDDNILFEQIEHLKQQAELYTFDADLQLLLGYQLLGIGEFDEAVEPLKQAGSDLDNEASANILLNLLAKIKTETEAQNTD